MTHAKLGHRYPRCSGHVLTVYMKWITNRWVVQITGIRYDVWKECTVGDDDAPLF